MMKSTRWILPLSLAVTTGLACAADGEATGSAGASAGASGDGADGDAGLGDPGDADGIEAPFAEACARLHGECAPVCDNVFVECYDDVATCTEQWTRDYLADYEAPLVDPVRVAACAAQVDAQSCTDLEPDTVECEYAVVEGCPDDDDGHGAVYSPFTPGRVQLGVPLDVRLCPGVEEFFAITLEAGTTLELVQPEGGPHVFTDLVRMSTAAGGEALLVRAGLDTPVVEAGEYLLAVDAADPFDSTLTLVRAP
jgi:hypothetical protein